MNKNVLFIGDSCVDINYYGDTKRKSPEVDGLNIFKVSKTEESRGMVYNTYNNFNNIVKNNDSGFITASLCTNNRNDSPIKHRFYANDKMVFRYDTNDKINYDVFDIGRIDLNDVSFVVISDYDKGFLSYENLILILQKCNERKIPTLIDTKKILIKEFKDFSFIKLNKEEFSNNENMISEYGFKNILCTLGSEGLRYNDMKLETPYIIEKGCPIYPEGCGDTFVAGFVFHYIQNHYVISALKFGMEMAGKVILRKGAVTPYI